MISAGFDPSLRAYGWAVHDGDATSKARRVASGHEGTLPSTVAVARFLHFQAMVKDVLSRQHVDVVGIESPAYEAGPFQSIHFGLMMFSLVPIFEARVDCVMFDPSTLKSLAKEDPNKKGAMGKLDMQRKVQIDTMDTHVIDNNEADAYLCAKFALRLKSLILGKISPEDLTGTEKRIFVERSRTVKSGLGKKKKRVGYVFRENSRFFEFSKVPAGSVSLPQKSSISSEILRYLEALETVDAVHEV